MFVNSVLDPVYQETELVNRYVEITTINTTSTYKFEVQSIVHNPGSWTISSTLIFPQETITNLTVVSITHNEINISWGLSTTPGSPTHFIAGEYEILFGLKDDVQSSYTTIDNVISPYTITDASITPETITPETEYTIIVRRIYANGYISAEDQIDCTTTKNYTLLMVALDFTQLILPDEFYVQFGDIAQSTQIEHDNLNMINGSLPHVAWYDNFGRPSDKNDIFTPENDSIENNYIYKWNGHIYNTHAQNGFRYVIEDDTKILIVWRWTWNTDIIIMNSSGDILYTYTEAEILEKLDSSSDIADPQIDRSGTLYNQSVRDNNDLPNIRYPYALPYGYETGMFFNVGSRVMQRKLTSGSQNPWQHEVYRAQIYYFYNLSNFAESTSSSPYTLTLYNPDEAIDPCNPGFNMSYLEQNFNYKTLHPMRISQFSRQPYPYIINKYLHINLDDARQITIYFHSDFFSDFGGPQTSLESIHVIYSTSEVSNIMDSLIYDNTSQTYTFNGVDYVSLSVSSYRLNVNLPLNDTTYYCYVIKKCRNYIGVASTSFVVNTTIIQSVLPPSNFTGTYNSSLYGGVDLSWNWDQSLPNHNRFHKYEITLDKFPDSTYSVTNSRIKSKTIVYKTTRFWDTLPTIYIRVVFNTPSNYAATHYFSEWCEHPTLATIDNMHEHYFLNLVGTVNDNLASMSFNNINSTGFNFTYTVPSSKTWKSNHYLGFFMISMYTDNTYTNQYYHHNRSRSSSQFDDGFGNGIVDPTIGMNGIYNHSTGGEFGRTLRDAQNISNVRIEYSDYNTFTHNPGGFLQNTRYIWFAPFTVGNNYIQVEYHYVYSIPIQYAEDGATEDEFISSITGSFNNMVLTIDNLMNWTLTYP